jgi:hypothetical protein
VCSLLSLNNLVEDLRVVLKGFRQPRRGSHAITLVARLDGVKRKA